VRPALRCLSYDGTEQTLCHDSCQDIVPEPTLRAHDSTCHSCCLGLDSSRTGSIVAHREPGKKYLLRQLLPSAPEAITRSLFP
jgi:hypothetical protein